MRTLIFALLLIFPNLALWADETDSIATDTVATRPLPGYFIDSDHDGIDDRQNEIDNFKPEPYWELKTLYRDTLFSSTKGKFKLKEDGEKLLVVISL